ncbi:MAG TPA: cytochrome c3 family protein [Verrucomicrobiae bacterium]|nr:cytochrome c3 family protein [Verrucomicrobiae bacterium]
MAAVAVVGLTVFLVSCATVDQVVMAPPMIPGAKYVGMDQCALCHEKKVKDFQLTAHARLRLRDTTNKEEVKDLGCEACHGPGSLHVDAGGGTPKQRFIISGKNPDMCFQCHLDKNAEFSLQYHHPVKEGRMSCTDCHDPHGEDINKPKGMFVGRVNEVCAQCHREQARPHVFEHEALREGCTTCHNVHGSINPKMLTERDNNLCLKCHAQIASPVLPGAVVIGTMPHAGFAPTDFLRQGTCFSAGCHTAVHGSDVDSHLRY